MLTDIWDRWHKRHAHCSSMCTTAHACIELLPSWYQDPSVGIIWQTSYSGFLLKKKNTNLCCARAPGRIAVLLALSCRVLWLLRFPWLKTSLENLSRCLGSVLLSKVSVLHLSNPADGAISTGWYFLNIQQKWVAKRYYLCGCCSSLSQEGLC